VGTRRTLAQAPRVKVPSGQELSHPRLSQLPEVPLNQAFVEISPGE
jgi:hypothetical protein